MRTPGRDDDHLRKSKAYAIKTRQIYIMKPVDIFKLSFVPILIGNGSIDRKLTRIGFSLFADFLVVIFFDRRYVCRTLLFLILK
jgi:hypothetical protein